MEELIEKIKIYFAEKMTAGEELDPVETYTDIAGIIEAYEEKEL